MTDKELDDSPYSEEERELLKFVEDLQEPPDIEASKAIDLILGDRTYVDEVTGEEFSFDEYEFLLSCNAELDAAKEVDDEELISEKQKELEDAKNLVVLRHQTRSAFYREIAEILNKKKNRNHVLLITQKNLAKSFDSTRLNWSSVLEWKSKSSTVCEIERSAGSILKKYAQAERSNARTKSIESSTITLALITYALSKTSPKLGKGKRPNLNQISQLVNDIATDRGWSPGNNGQGVESIRKRLNGAIKLLEERESQDL